MTFSKAVARSEAVEIARAKRLGRRRMIRLLCMAIAAACFILYLLVSGEDAKLADEDAPPGPAALSPALVPPDNLG